MYQVGLHLTALRIPLGVQHFLSDRFHEEHLALLNKGLLRRRDRFAVLFFCRPEMDANGGTEPAQLLEYHSVVVGAY